MAKTTSPSPLVFCTVCLGSIFDDVQPMLLGHLEDGIHIRRMPIKVDNHNCLGPLGHLLLNLSWIHIPGIPLTVHQYWMSAHETHSVRCRDVCDGRDDNLVPGANTESNQCQMQGCGPARNGDSVSYVAIRTKGLFKPGHIPSLRGNPT